jgi:hypothetical protein
MMEAFICGDDRSLGFVNEIEGLSKYNPTNGPDFVGRGILGAEVKREMRVDISRALRLRK